AQVDVGGFLELLLGLELLALDDRGHRGVAVFGIARRELRHHLARAVAVELVPVLRLQREEAVRRAPQALGRVRALGVALRHARPGDDRLVHLAALHEERAEQEARLRAELRLLGGPAREHHRLLAEADRALEVAALHGGLGQPVRVDAAERPGRGRAEQLAPALAAWAVRIELDQALGDRLDALRVAELLQRLRLLDEDRETL